MKTERLVSTENIAGEVRSSPFHVTTGADGTVNARLANYLLSRPPDEGAERESQTLTSPRRLIWNTDGTVLNNLNTARAEFDKLVASNSIQSMWFTSYGSSFIKSQGCSPDAWTQMAIQLAYYLSVGYVVPTYESAATRKYAYGRTETMRSVTCESKRFVEALCNPELNAVEQYEAMQVAIKKHVELLREAVNGQGVDRHLLGLKLAAQDGGCSIPDLLTDTVFAKSSTWKLSTSNITSPYFEAGWGAVVDDGIGVCYGTKDSCITFKVSAKAKAPMGPVEFCQCLRAALLRMQQISLRCSSKL